jgi:RNA polymerase sigma-70 factor (ECF subfamily)
MATPPESSPPDITQMLRRWSEGERGATEDLIPAVHQELGGIARRYLRKERQGHTLETSALVNEAYIKLIDQGQVEWRNRAHFFAIAAQSMRRILVDHARAKGFKKRGGDVPKVELDEAFHLSAEAGPEVLALDDALKDLAQIDEQRARIVELRFFGGLSHAEIAEVLGISLSTVERSWRMARAWLFTTLS